MTRRILFFYLLAILFASCSHTGNVTRDTISRQLIFGNGGGFAGTYTTYELNDDGRVFVVTNDNSKRAVRKLRKKETLAIFNRADEIRKSQPSFNHPGNMTWFVKYKTGDELFECKWGDSNFAVPGDIQVLYNQLNAIVN